MLKKSLSSNRENLTRSKFHKPSLIKETKVEMLDKGGNPPDEEKAQMYHELLQQQSHKLS